MALNYIWIAFFVIAFIVALVKLIFFGDVEVFLPYSKALLILPSLALRFP